LFGLACESGRRACRVCRLVCVPGWSLALPGDAGSKRGAPGARQVAGVMLVRAAFRRPGRPTVQICVALSIAPVLKFNLQRLGCSLCTRGLPRGSVARNATRRRESYEHCRQVRRRYWFCSLQHCLRAPLECARPRMAPVRRPACLSPLRTSSRPAALAKSGSRQFRTSRTPNLPDSTGRNWPPVLRSSERDR